MFLTLIYILKIIDWPMRIRDGDQPFKLPGSDSPLKSTVESIQKALLLQQLFMEQKDSQITSTM
jgi:hypothetical protein